MTRYIYVIGSAEFSPIKVGIAANPKSRLAALQCGNPFRLSILGMFEGTSDDEKRLHKKLEPYKTVGEWFDVPSSDPVEFVRSIFPEPYDPNEEVWLGKFDGWDYYATRELVMDSA